MKFEHTKVMNWEGAFRGMRNPKNSWDKSDSEIEKYYEYQLDLGEKDIDLAQRLIKAGRDHRKFLRQILVCVDITAPLYWWKEFDTYKVGTVSNSCSTMHTITDKPIELSDFTMNNFHIDDPYDDIALMDMFINVISDCELLRRKYLETNDKKYWRGLIQLLPSSYNQKRTITFNYEVLYNIRHSQRATHKLDEWRIEFMNWIDSLPYAEELLKIS